MDRKRFMPKRIEIAIDGVREYWEYIGHNCKGKKMTVNYELKKTEKYETEI